MPHRGALLGMIFNISRNSDLMIPTANRFTGRANRPHGTRRLKVSLTQRIGCSLSGPSQKITGCGISAVRNELGLMRHTLLSI